MNLVRINKEYKDLKIRDMSELEIQGAILYLYELVSETEEFEFGEIYTTINEVKNLTYYCGNNLQIQDCYYAKSFYISSLFMVENSYNTLFCVCSNDEYFEESFVCRVDLTE